MLNFIVCEDDKVFQQEVKHQIEKFMMKSDINYRVYLFDDYGSEFEKAVKDELGFKIYFLDIKTEYGSGLDAARFIREENDDWNSILVVITAYSEYRFDALTSRLYLLDFINKLDNCNKRIQSVLEIIMKSYSSRDKSLSYEYNYMVNKIAFRDILYIEKEQNSKRCIVHTSYEQYKVPKTLAEVETSLDDRFLKVHRSLIANLDKIKKYDVKNNVILFKDGSETNLISRDKKKELIERVTTNH